MSAREFAVGFTPAMAGLDDLPRDPDLHLRNAALARLTGGVCQVCGAVSLDPECRRCAIDEETRAKRREDRP